jgi:Tol biopolymer transport system component
VSARAARKRSRLLIGAVGGLSALVLLPAGLVSRTDAAGATRAPSTTRVSVDSAGAQANGRSDGRPAISRDGRFVAFGSSAANLVPGDTNGRGDVFVHDRQSRTTTRVSVDGSGAQANEQSWRPAISADGRLVAFASRASNLVAGDTNGAADIFVHDRLTRATTRVSVSSGGAQGTGESADPSLSADGRSVAFVSFSSNLVPGDTNRWEDVFVHDRATRTTRRVSVGSAGTQGNSFSIEPSISGDGSFIAFRSDASNLVPGDTNQGHDVFIRDLRRQSTTRVSISNEGAQASCGRVYESQCSWDPSLSADGRLVAFTAGAPNLVARDTNEDDDVFVRDRLGGTTTRVSVSSSGAQGDWSSNEPAISAEGRFVAFTSRASNLVAGGANDWDDIFVHDLATGSTAPASVSSSGEWANGGSLWAASSGGGRAVAFVSRASNLVAGDTNGFFDVFVRDTGPPAPSRGSCRVPKVVGLRLATARKRIRRARCAVGRVRRVPTRSTRRNRVLAQFPRAGMRGPRGTRVRLVVGRRPPNR